MDAQSIKAEICVRVLKDFLARTGYDFQARKKQERANFLMRRA